MMKYERPDLEEMELMLEGSFLAYKTGVDVGNKPVEGEDEDVWD